MHKCSECRIPSTDLERLACGCMVHPACLSRRENLCMMSGVPAFRCAQCWQFVWNARKRRQSDEEDTGAEEFKKLRM